MPTVSPTLIGVTWYMSTDYARMRKLFKDGAKLPRTYARWLKAATATQSTLESMGFKVIKAYVDPDTFPAWCKSRRLDIDGNARLQYGNWYVDNGFGHTH